MHSGFNIPEPTGLERLSPMEFADVMLLEVLARGHGSLLLRPEGDGYTLSFHGDQETSDLVTIPLSLAEATLMRLALIAGQPVAPPQVDRLRIRLASHLGTADTGNLEMLLSLRPTSMGIAAELFALRGTRAYEEAATVSGIDGIPDAAHREAKYEVIGELGRGGMGIVYLARHVTLDKQVALKVLSPAMAQRHMWAAQFVVEARAACRARHPAIIDVTDFGRLSDGRNYLVMEYVGWPTLAEVLRSGPMEPRRAVAIARSIAEGLAMAHTHGVVHRDLKPGNIFVGESAQVKVADFGLARTTEGGRHAIDMEGVCFGTIPYMAPEQTLGQPVDHRADIYSFGCILYELLTGATPFASDDSLEIAEGHRHRAIPELPVQCLVPARLAQLQKDLLGKSPGERPGSFASVIEVLDACIEELR